jgi:hypothetical protein
MLRERRPAAAGGAALALTFFTLSNSQRFAAR